MVLRYYFTWSASGTQSMFHALHDLCQKWLWAGKSEQNMF